MNLTNLIDRTRLYARDTNTFMFSDALITSFINEAIDVISEYSVFNDMEYLTISTDTPELLPARHHYLLALYASSRCFEFDQRFYEATEKRNEFEAKFYDLIAEIQGGNVVIKDADGNEIEDKTKCTDEVVDVYFVKPKTEGIFDTPVDVDD